MFEDTILVVDTDPKKTAVLPLFPYSRQSEVPYNKIGAPLSKTSNCYNKLPFECAISPPLTNGVNGVQKMLSTTPVEEPSSISNGPHSTQDSSSDQKPPKRSDTSSSTKSEEIPFNPRPGYKQWVAQSGTLVADLLTCAGADHVITMDLHDPQYQGFFDIPVDNLHSRPILKRHIQQSIPNYQQAVVVSPDAGGAKRATAIADALGMPFALIHKVTPLRNGNEQRLTLSTQERRPTNISDRQTATMLLVGNVTNRTVILIDDLADTSNTITRAAKLLKKEGATKVYALITHGVLSGDAIERINNSSLDKLIVTNSVPQEEHERLCPKLEVLDVGHVFAEVRLTNS